VAGDLGALGQCADLGEAEAERLFYQPADRQPLCGKVAGELLAVEIAVDRHRAIALEGWRAVLGGIFGGKPLPSCKRAVDGAVTVLGGTLILTSEIGRGTHFQITL
jgi:hypothetical protein